MPICPWIARYTDISAHFTPFIFPGQNRVMQLVLEQYELQVVSAFNNN